MGQVSEPVHDVAERDRRSGKQPSHRTNEENGDADQFGLPGMRRGAEIGGEAEVKAAMTTRNEAQKICSQRPWKMRRKTTMLPIAPSKPITAYNMATTSPPMNWLLDPAPVRRFCSKAESILLDAPTPCPAPQSRLCGATLRFHRLEWLHLDPLLGLR
jgi:hypothetical protein